MAVPGFLGSDLQVLPHLAAHDAAETDLVLRTRVAVVVRPDGTIDRGATAPAEVHDLATWTGRENLAQALALRLLTPLGSLAELGHAGYGSRLHELIGQPKSQAQRNLCRAFVLEALAQEQRLDPAALAFAFDTAAETVDSLVFTVQVQPRDGAGPLELTLEVGL
jgi:phage baseplate assembly protein W